MRAGQLRHRVTHLTRTGTPDGQGGRAVAWADGAEFYAWVRPVTARDALVVAGLQTNATHLVTARYRTGIAATDRLRQEPDGPTLEVLGVRNEDGRNIALTIDCAEVI